MQEQNGSTTAAAPMPDLDKRAEVKRLVEAAAFDTGRDCEHCGGTGSVYPGRRIVHSIVSGFGADWDVEDVLAAIDAAEYVRWLTTPGHALVVEVGGKPYRFAVQPPEVTA